MSEKGQVRKSMFSVQNMEELGVSTSDTPVLHMTSRGEWSRAGRQSTVHRGQLVALTQGADRGNRKRTMAVSPSVAMDATKL